LESINAPSTPVSWEERIVTRRRRIKSLCNGRLKNLSEKRKKKKANPNPGYDQRPKNFDPIREKCSNGIPVREMKG